MGKIAAGQWQLVPDRRVPLPFFGPRRIDSEELEAFADDFPIAVIGRVFRPLQSDIEAILTYTSSACREGPRQTSLDWWQLKPTAAL